MAGIFGIGISGIQAAQLGMLVTQHNITNSNTEGYNRQSVKQSTAIPVGTAIGFTGNGVQVNTIARQYNTFLTDQVRRAETQHSSLDAYFSQIEVIDDLLADTNAGVSPALQDFFAGVQEVANAPASLPARQSMVSAAQALVARLQGADQRISDMYGQVNQQVSDLVSLVNTYGKQIAKLNEQITQAQSAVGQPANDLLDKRDQLISELNKIVQVQTVPVQDGQVQVFIGQGQLLVTGNRSNPMAAVRSSEDPSRVTVALDLGAGNLELPDGVITGGELGGLLDFRSETLDRAVNSLGKVAASLALTFNAQHEVGMDMLGNSLSDASGGVDFVSQFFTIPDPKVIPTASSTGDISATFSKPVLTDIDLVTDPSGGEMSANYFTHLTNSDYRLQYDGASYTLTRLTDDQQWSAASIADLNDIIGTRGTDPQGFELTENVAAAAGDSFMIQPTRAIAKNIEVDSQIAGDVRLLAAGSAVRAAPATSNTGSMAVSVTRMLGQTSALAGTSVTYSGGMLVFSGGPGTSVRTVDSTGIVSAEDVSGSVLFEPGKSYLVDNVMFTIQGRPADGDVINFSWNDDHFDNGGAESVGVSDSSNILLLGKLQSQNTLDGGTVSYQGGYAQMVSDIGNKAREVEVTRDAQKSLADQASASREAESGVNLDEEAANLLKFQQLYQASARSISVGQKLFDELLSIARG